MFLSNPYLQVCHWHHSAQGNNAFHGNWVLPWQQMPYGQTTLQGRQPFFYPSRQDFSYIRMLHASPETPSVDLFINNTIIARGLGYKEFTEYMPVFPGIYNVTVFKSGTTGPSLLRTAIEVPGRSINTAAFIGMSPDLAIKTFFETVIAIPPGQLYLRFANLSPGSPEMDLEISDGTRLFSNVTYGMATNYTALPAGMHVFQLRQSNTGRRLLYVPNIYLADGRFYTIYAVGQVVGNVPLQVLIPLDGNSYIQTG